MIEKMAYVNITGPRSDFDSIVDTYLSRYEIHLENAMMELADSENFIPFSETNPYKDLVSKAEALEELLSSGAQSDEKKKTKPLSPAKQKKAQAKADAFYAKKFAGREMSLEDATEFINSYTDGLKADSDAADELKSRIAALKEDLESLLPFENLGCRLEDILGFKHICYRFGRMPKEAWKHFNENVNAKENNIFNECSRDSKYIYGVYFTTPGENDRIDSLYASLKFERMEVCGNYTGTPKEICENLRAEIAESEDSLKTLQSSLIGQLAEKADELWLAKDAVSRMSFNFDARRMAVCTKYQDSDIKVATDPSFFILCGWMRLKDARDLSASLEKTDTAVSVIVNEKPTQSGLKPPTSIKNRGVFKPFEMYTKMYGLPAYNEFDPTIFLGLTYSFIFGAMFGDLGHGLVLLIGGALIYFIKKSQLAGIISCAGFFSSIFGVLFGSVFGFENIIEPLWLSPMKAMSTLNFVGRIKTVFVLAVAFGMFLMLVLMIINIISSIKQKDFKSCIFSQNGIAGFVFYGSLTLVVFLFMGNKPLPASIILVLLLGVPALCIALKEPLTNLLNKKKALETGVGMFCIEAFFDLFEVCLTFLSNTLSYLRIGAFALSHAAMMEVVLSLTGYAEGGQGSIVGLILGNVVVIGFEGLIVGIQVLRLEYYEFFSRFYKGSGRAFTPYFKKRRDI